MSSLSGLRDRQAPASAGLSSSKEVADRASHRRGTSVPSQAPVSNRALHPDEGRPGSQRPPASVHSGWSLSRYPRLGSNQRPPDPESGALSAALRGWGGGGESRTRKSLALVPLRTGYRHHIGWLLRESGSEAAPRADGYPCRESNPDPRLRRPVPFPLDHMGVRRPAGRRVRTRRGIRTLRLRVLSTAHMPVLLPGREVERIGIGPITSGLQGETVHQHAPRNVCVAYPTRACRWERRVRTSTSCFRGNHAAGLHQLPRGRRGRTRRPVQRCAARAERAGWTAAASAPERPSRADRWPRWTRPVLVGAAAGNRTPVFAVARRCTSVVLPPRCRRVPRARFERADPAFETGTSSIGSPRRENRRRESNPLLLFGGQACHRGHPDGTSREPGSRTPRFLVPGQVRSPSRSFPSARWYPVPPGRTMPSTVEFSRHNTAGHAGAAQGRQDSNLQPLVLETSALPLSYAPRNGRRRPAGDPEAAYASRTGALGEPPTGGRLSDAGQVSG